MPCSVQSSRYSIAVILLNFCWRRVSTIVAQPRRTGNPGAGLHKEPAPAPAHASAPAGVPSTALHLLRVACTEHSRDNHPENTCSALRPVHYSTDHRSYPTMTSYMIPRTSHTARKMPVSEDSASASAPAPAPSGGNQAFPAHSLCCISPAWLRHGIKRQQYLLSCTRAHQHFRLSNSRHTSKTKHQSNGQPSRPISCADWLRAWHRPTRRHGVRAQEVQQDCAGGTEPDPARRGQGRG